MTIDGMFLTSLTSESLKTPQNNIRTYLYLINISQILHRIQEKGTQNFLAKHAPRYSTSVVNSISFMLMINLSFLQGVLSSSTSKHQILKEFIKRCTEVVHLSRCVSHIVHSFFYLWGVCLLHVELLYLYNKHPLAYCERKRYISILINKSPLLVKMPLIRKVRWPFQFINPLVHEIINWSCLLRRHNLFWRFPCLLDTLFYFNPSRYHPRMWVGNVFGHVCVSTDLSVHLFRL